ncbi:MAG: hypothetical protein WEB59_08955 [Thermoanaerobaculia bacterium]
MKTTKKDLRVARQTVDDALEILSPETVLKCVVGALRQDLEAGWYDGSEEVAQALLADRIEAALTELDPGYVTWAACMPGLDADAKAEALAEAAAADRGTP